MQTIQILDHNTIDQIAAGEVVERPASIVKELVENAMDAGADAITVEIRDGGIAYIRVTDNGCGIYEEDLPYAFLRHATSKIHDISDLERLHSMGFRGEALASIASVSRVTMITRRSEELLGHRIRVEGGEVGEVEELGAPEGTTITVEDLFYNTPARRKFLKSATSEGNAVQELMEHLALARPDISYQFVLGGRVRFLTTGLGDLRDVIYRVYGRDMSRAVVPVSYEKDGIRIDGYLGEPSLNRPNRNFENYFLNRRYVRSDVLSRGIEEGYRGYTMQHRFPFCVLHISMDSAQVDVNVHPAKMDVRFHDRQQVFDRMSEAVAGTLHANEMIPKSVLEREAEKKERISLPEPFEAARREELAQRLGAYAEAGRESKGEANGKAQTVKTAPRDIFEVDFSSEGEEPCVVEYGAQGVKTADAATPSAGAAMAGEAATSAGLSVAGEAATSAELSVAGAATTSAKTAASDTATPSAGTRVANQQANTMPQDSNAEYTHATQMEMLPRERVISANARRQYRLIGCIFNTYWMFAYQDKLYFVDQHAAHEKVNYERLVEQYQSHQVFTQQCDPPIVVSLSLSESEVLEAYLQYFQEMGFHIEPFGGSEYAISTVPYDLYRKNPRQLFLEMLDELSLKGMTDTPQIVDRVLATIACKAAVKGGDVISMQEMDAVLDELLTLKNPYHCPHGRPTIFSMSRTELERKFKRIVN